MKELALLLVAVAILPGIICPPVTVKPPAPAERDPDVQPVEEDVNLGLEYERYLKEVVNVLETDPLFKKKLEETNISDIKSGDIAKHLELVSHNVRSKLDELKRQELERLRNVVRMQIRQRNGDNDNGVKNFDPMRLVAHMDHSNPQTFEISDLEKLIKQATVDLEEIDKQRKEEFKKYEMEKEYLRQEKLKNLDEGARKAEELKYENMKQKHKEHPKLHHPGGREQLEEVWEETDGLDPDNFDPRTFFKLHDQNGDGYLDQWEVEALFNSELDKVYDPNAPEDDMMERYEEMNRMREHVMNEVDRDRDSMISYKEFIDSTKEKEFEEDEGWDTLDDQQLYTDEEMQRFQQEYERRRQQEYRRQQMAQNIPGNVPPVDPNMHRPPPPPHMQGQQPGGVQPPQHMGGQPLQFQPGEGLNDAQKQFMEQQQQQAMAAQAERLQQQQAQQAVPQQGQPVPVQQQQPPVPQQQQQPPVPQQQQQQQPPVPQQQQQQPPVPQQQQQQPPVPQQQQQQPPVPQQQQQQQPPVPQQPDVQPQQ